MKKNYEFVGKNNLLIKVNFIESENLYQLFINDSILPDKFYFTDLSEVMDFLVEYKFI